MCFIDTFNTWAWWITFSLLDDPQVNHISLKTKFNFISFSETDSHIQNDNCQSDHENGLDIENDDDYPMMSDLDVADHDPNDMSRPRKIRR